MIDFDVSNWKTFKIGDLFPPKKYLKYSKKPEAKGNVQFVSSTSLNNGVSGFVDETPIVSNCITVSTNGACFDAFYHDEPIVISSDVEVLKNNKLNKYSGLFICTVLMLEKPKWAYGRKPKRNAVFNSEIKLPEKNGNPDWEMMELLMKACWINGLSTSNLDFSSNLDKTSWGKFCVKDIFSKIYKAKAHHKIYLNEAKCFSGNTIQYIARTEKNNGFESFVTLENEQVIEEGNAISIGDTTATCFFQDEKFLSGDHIVILRDPNLNKYNGLFIVTLLNYEKFRYSYGRAFKLDSISNTEIILPSKDGKPDWEYMENYIKSLPYGDRI